MKNRAMKSKFEPSRIFVVENDPNYQRMVKYIMEMNPDHEVYVFPTGTECIKNLYLKPSIISLEHSLPDMSGNELLKEIKAFDKDISVIVLSAQNDIAIAVQLLKEGASDYITKDKDAKERLMNTLLLLKDNRHLKKELALLKKELETQYEFSKTIIGNSKSMKTVFTLLEKAVKTNITVSITGETGTGKEVVAKSIHHNSLHKKGTFVAINMSAIPKELLESELFGYEKGAFTGANTKKIGKLELAHHGTLFLDEIGEMDINMQAKLLRCIQEREIVRIGGNKPIKFNARIIVATHRDLAEEVSKGNFREDLYYRLLGLPIKLPPLRERGNDIILLARHFLMEFSRRNGLSKVNFTRKAKDKLLAYSYPGNVRELRASVELSAVMAIGNMVDAEDIRFNSPKRTLNFLTEEMTLKKYNYKIVRHFLERHNNDVLLVAKKLDIGKSTIYRMLNVEKSLTSKKDQTSNIH